MSNSVLKFLIVGGFGFLIDSSLTMGLIQLGLSPLIARPPAIFITMIFTWQANRQYTFNVAKARNLPEFLRYTTTALIAALLNYFIYSALIILSWPPLSALIIATCIASILSFFCYKNFVFISNFNS